MRPLLFRCLLAASLAAPAALAGQAPPPPAAGAILPISQRVDSIRSHFEKAAGIAQERIRTNGWGELKAREAYVLRVDEIRATLVRFGRKPTLDDAPAVLGAQLRDFFLAVDSIYGVGAPLPAGINDATADITLAFLDHLQLLNEEYYRRFFIKYGKSSERLNLAEMAILNWWSADPVQSAEQQLGPWEPILRLQSVGYQVRVDDGDFGPSSPVLQVGASYYLFGRSTAARWINHVGLAGAYQRDLDDGEDRWGVVGHVNRFDLGLLCQAWPCSEPVVMVSTNLQLISNVF